MSSGTSAAGAGVGAGSAGVAEAGAFVTGAVGADGTSVRCKLLSISPLLPFFAATKARDIDSRMNKVANIVVVRVRKSAAPRADIRPDGLPPMPKPPPSERCINMTPTSDAAIMP